MKRFCPKRISSVQLKEEGLYLASGSLWNYKLSLWYIGLLTWQIQSMIKQHSVCLNLKKILQEKTYCLEFPSDHSPPHDLKCIHPILQFPVLFCMCLYHHGCLKVLNRLKIIYSSFCQIKALQFVLLCIYLI